MHDGPVYVLADRKCLAVLITHLVDNAIKFTIAGAIEIHAMVTGSYLRASSQKQKDVGNQKNTDNQKNTGKIINFIFMFVTRVLVSISNSKRSFTAFTQAEGAARRFGELVWGLAVYKLLQLMDGHIKVDSQIGQGSCFS